MRRGKRTPCLFEKLNIKINVFSSELTDWKKLATILINDQITILTNEIKKLPNKNLSEMGFFDKMRVKKREVKENKVGGLNYILEKIKGLKETDELKEHTFEKFVEEAKSKFKNLMDSINSRTSELLYEIDTYYKNAYFEVRNKKVSSINYFLLKHK